MHRIALHEELNEDMRIFEVPHREGPHRNPSMGMKMRGTFRARFIDDVPMLTVNGFSIAPPADFDLEEMTVGLRRPAQNASVIVQSKRARDGATLDALATETTVELSQSLPGMENLARSALTFDDGGEGIVLSYDWQTHQGRLRQYFVIRLASGKQCSMTVTVPRDGVTPESAGELMRVIMSLRPV